MHKSRPAQRAVLCICVSMLPVPVCVQLNMHLQAHETWLSHRGHPTFYSKSHLVTSCATTLVCIRAHVAAGPGSSRKGVQQDLLSVSIGREAHNNKLLHYIMLNIHVVGLVTAHAAAHMCCTVSADMPAACKGSTQQIPEATPTLKATMSVVLTSAGPVTYRSQLQSQVPTSTACSPTKLSWWLSSSSQHVNFILEGT